MARARLAQPRLPAGRRQARSAAARRLSVQHHHRRHRAGRRLPARRHQSALGSADRQRAHPQALPARRLPDRRDRAAARSDLPVEHLGAGPQTLAEIADGRHPFAEVLKAAKKPMLILGRARCAGADGAAVLDLAARASPRPAAWCSEGWNGFNVLHTAAARVGGLDLGFVPGTGGRDVGRHPRRRREGRDRGRLSARRRRDRHGAASARPSSSIRAITAMPARIAPTSSCRAPPTPRRTRPTSTPRAACSDARWPSSRRARRARTGRSSAPCPRCSASGCPTTTSASCAGAWSQLSPRFERLDAVRAGGLGRVRQRRAPIDAAPFALADREFLHDRSDQPRLRDHGASARRRFVRAAAGEDRHPWMSFWTGYVWPTAASSSSRSWPSSCRCCSCVAYLTYAERKVIGGDAAAQGARTWSGPFGLLQPFADGAEAAVQGDDHPDAAPTASSS